MAIARVFECAGWTPEQYDQLIAGLNRRLNLSGQSAPGVLFHWVARTANGMRATDVYESREAADRLAMEQIGPLTQELNLSMPEITEYEVYSYLEP
jgi:hypothetical protein